jgi:hypothetical protein
MNMRAQQLINWRLGAPFFVAPGNGRLPSLRQWIYLLVGGGLLLTAERLFPTCHEPGVDRRRSAIHDVLSLVQDCLSAYRAGRRHSLRGMLQ